MAREKNVEENGRGPMIVESVLEPSDMYLVLPSYAEPHKQAIKNIVAAEKQNYAAIVYSKHALEILTLKLHGLTTRKLNKW